MRTVLAVAAGVALAGCSTFRPPVTQIEAIAACYTAVVDERQDLEVDRSSTRAQQEPNTWTITGAGSAGSDAVTFSCEVSDVGEVVRVSVDVGEPG
jgi:hypothetical protein